MEVLGEWLRSGGGPQDILDDTALYLAFKSFLESSSDHSIPESQYRDNAEVIESWASLRDRVHALSALFSSQTLRPSIPKTLAQEERTILAGAQNFVELPDFDRMTPGQLVNEFNTMATAAFRNVTEEVGCSISKRQTH
jgi:hypothetical protein